MLNILCTTLLPNFYSVNLKYFIFSIRVENSEDPDQMASSEPADLDQQCFLKSLNQGSAGQASE